MNQGENNNWEWTKWIFHPVKSIDGYSGENKGLKRRKAELERFMVRHKDYAEAVETLGTVGAELAQTAKALSDAHLRLKTAQEDLEEAEQSEKRLAEVKALILRKRMELTEIPDLVGEDAFDVKKAAERQKKIEDLKNEISKLQLEEVELSEKIDSVRTIWNDARLSVATVDAERARIKEQHDLLKKHKENIKLPKKNPH